MSWLLDSSQIAGKLTNLASKVQTMAESALEGDQISNNQQHHQTRLQEELIRLDQALTDKDRTILELEAKIKSNDGAEQRIADLQDKLNRAAQYIKLVTAENAHLKEEFPSTQNNDSTTHNLMNQLSSLRDQNAYFELQLQEKNAQLDGFAVLIEQHTELKSEYASLGIEVGSLKRKIELGTSELPKDIEVNESENNHLQIQLDGLKNDISLSRQQHHEESHEAQERINQLQSQLQLALDTSNNTFDDSTKLEEMESAIQTKDQQMEHYKNESDSKLESLQNNLNRIKSLASEKIKKLMGTNNELTSEIEQLKSINADGSFSNEGQNGDKRVQELEIEIHQRDEVILGLRQDLDDSAIQMEESHLQISALSGQNNELNSGLDSARKQIEKLHHDLLELNNEDSTDKSQHNIDSLNRKIQDQSKLILDLQQQIGKLVCVKIDETQLAEYANASKSFHIESENLRSQTYQLEIELEQSQSSLKSKMFEFSSTLDIKSKLESQYKSEIESLKAQVQMITTTAVSVGDNLAISPVLEMLLDAKFDMGIFKASVSNFEQTLAYNLCRLSEFIQNLQKELIDLKGHASELESKSLQNESSLDENKQLLQLEIERLNIQTQELQESYTEQESMALQLSRERKDLEKELHEYQLLKKERNKLLIDNERLSSDIERLSSLQRSDLDDKVQLLQSHIESLNKREKELHDSLAEQKSIALQICLEKKTLEEESQSYEVLKKIHAELIIDNQRLSANLESVSKLVPSDLGLDDKVHLLQSEIESLNNRAQELQESFTEQESLAIQLSHENQDLEIDRSNLSNKLTHLKEIIGPKLKSEMEECQKLRGQLAVAAEEKQVILMELGMLKESIASKDSTPSPFVQAQIDDLSAQNEKLNREVERLRHFLLEVEENQTRDGLGLESKLAEYRQQIEQLEASRDELNQVMDQERQIRQESERHCEQAKKDFNEAFAESALLKSKLEANSGTLQNLQQVLEQFQMSISQLSVAKDSDIKEALDNLNNLYINSLEDLKKWQERAEIAEVLELLTQNQLQTLRTEMPRRKSTIENLEAKDILIGKLRYDVIQLQSHLSEAMRRMRSGVNDENVDRALLTNLVVNFVSAPRATSKPFEALSVLASVLKLSDENRVKIGLIRQAGITISPRESVAAGEGFMDMWIAFLQKETMVTETNQSIPDDVAADHAALEIPTPIPFENKKEQSAKSSSYLSRLLGG